MVLCEWKFCDSGLRCSRVVPHAKVKHGRSLWQPAVPLRVWVI
jgi:hypothetical protein